MVSVSDPLADMLTRIRNGQRAKLLYVNSPVSKLRIAVLNVLKSEGYIRDFSKTRGSSKYEELRIELKYLHGMPVIREVQRLSKPGRRMYSSIKNLQYYYNGLGVAILSTPKGVMSDVEARKANIGGELLCKIF